MGRLLSPISISSLLPFLCVVPPVGRTPNPLKQKLTLEDETRSGASRGGGGGFRRQVREISGLVCLVLVAFDDCKRRATMLSSSLATGDHLRMLG